MSLKISSTIRCPHCNEEIPLSEALFHQIEERVKERESALRKTILVEIQEKHEKKLRESIAREHALELQDLKDRLQEREEKENKSQKEELALRKKIRELEDAKKEMHLEMERQLDERIKAAEEENAIRVAEQHTRALAEKDAKIREMHQKVVEMERRLAQGSQQLQGEVAEQKLEERLRAQFPQDKFVPVPKGRNGADVVHCIHADRSGVDTGCKVLFESKETKDYSNDWISKLKRDQSLVKADIAVLVTTALPKGELRPLYYEDNVWVVKPQVAIELAIALRAGLIGASNVRRLMEKEGGSKEAVFRYFTGNEFHLRIMTILSAIRTLKENLEAERRAFERVWAVREKELNQILKGTAGIVGDVQGVAGQKLVSIPELELSLVAPGKNKKAKGSLDV